MSVIKRTLPFVSAAASLAILTIAGFLIGNTQHASSATLANANGTSAKDDAASNRMCTAQGADDEIYFISCGGIY